MGSNAQLLKSKSTLPLLAAGWHIAVGSGKHEAWKVQQVEQGNGKVQDEFEILMTFASRKQGQVLWFKNIIWNKLMFMHNCTQLEKNGIAHETGAHSTVVLVLLAGCRPDDRQGG